MRSALQDADALFKRAEREHWTPNDPRWEALSMRETKATVKAGHLIGSGFEAGQGKAGGLGTPVVALYGSGLLRPGLYLLNGIRVRASFELADDGSPHIELLDANRRARAVLGRTALQTITTGESVERPESSLVLFDKDGKVVWKTP